MKRNIIIAIAIILAAAFLLSAQGKDSMAANFTAKDIAGKNVELYGYKDKVVILDFWATWCGPCRREIPNLVDIKKTFRDKPFEIISIALERGDDEDAKKFVKTNKMDWVHIIDKEVGRKIAEEYKIMYIPTMYIIKNGKILATGLRGEELKTKLKALLKG